MSAADLVQLEPGLREDAGLVVSAEQSGLARFTKISKAAGIKAE